jgi:DNA-binding transcriptional MerR regulator/effector-binding domain-containing protein
MQDLFSIGEFARLFNINIRTLRYYDDIGILKPEIINEQTGYRYYGTKQFERLNTIRYLRALDMPLAKIREFFENRDVDKILDILGEHRAEIQRRKKELEMIEKKIEGRMAQIEDALRTEYGRIEEKRLPGRILVALKKTIPVGEDLEVPIRELERSSHLNSGVFLGKIGVSIAKEDLKARRFENFLCIFLLLEEDETSADGASRLPEGDYAVMRFRGTHREAGACYGRLLDYMEEKGYEAAGDSMEITMIDSGLTDDTSKYITEIQIPYRKKA